MRFEQAAALLHAHALGARRDRGAGGCRHRPRRVEWDFQDRYVVGTCPPNDGGVDGGTDGGAPDAGTIDAGSSCLSLTAACGDSQTPCCFPTTCANGHCCAPDGESCGGDADCCQLWSDPTKCMGGVCCRGHGIACGTAP